MFRWFGKKYNYERIAEDFVEEFDNRFQRGIGTHIRILDEALSLSPALNSDMIETIFSDRKTIEALYLGLFAESCIPWANIIGPKSEKNFVEAALAEGKKKHPNIFSNRADFGFIFHDCKTDPTGTRLRILAFAFARFGPLTKRILDFLSADPLAQLMVQGTLSEDGIIGILKDMENAGQLR